MLHVETLEAPLGSRISAKLGFCSGLLNHPLPLMLEIVGCEGAMHRAALRRRRDCSTAQGSNCDGYGRRVGGGASWLILGLLSVHCELSEMRNVADRARSLTDIDRARPSARAVDSLQGTGP